MISDDSDILRPYPIDQHQDRIVERLVFVKRKLIPRIVLGTLNAVTYPLRIFKRRSDRQERIDENLQEKTYDEICPIYVSTKSEVMDSKYYYAVRDGKIWFKPIAAHIDSPWKLFNANGSIDDYRIPVIIISADGDNIIAVDEERTIHYAKTNRVICEVSFDCPSWKILRSNVHWTNQWFSMDGVSLIVNRLKDPLLRFSENWRSIAISHKGHDTMYYTDMNGKKHPDPYVGVTTVYALNEDGTRIFFADPWLNNKFQNELTTPEEGQFQAETLVASGSTLFLIQRGKNEVGQEIHRMYTRFADFDSIGSNPALKSTYNIRNSLPLIRYLPAEDWTRQPSITLDGRARLTKNISILQTGWGQNNRQLRVQGQDSMGRNGFYYKRVYETDWKFQMVEGAIIDEDEFLSESIPLTGLERGPSIAHDYENGMLRPHARHQLKQIRLEKFSRQGFNERGLHTQIVLVFQDETILSLKLYARRGWKSLFGISDESIWKLIIPWNYFDYDHSEMIDVIRHVFHNKYKHSVIIQEFEDRLVIKSQTIVRPKFEFIFRTKQD